MKIFSIVLATLVIIFGLRLVLTAFQTVLSGKILVRRGVRTRWEVPATRNDAWKAAFRDGLMGLLLILLGFLLIF